MSSALTQFLLCSTPDWEVAEGSVLSHGAHCSGEELLFLTPVSKISSGVPVIMFMYTVKSG